MPETRQLMMSGLMMILLALTAPGRAMLTQTALEPTLSAEQIAAESKAAELRAIRSLATEHSSAAARELAGVIHREAMAAGVDPLMVAAIVAEESSFRTTVVSRSGAVGLMQLRPFVAQDVAERIDLEWSGTTMLNQPKNNLRLGIRYYSELVERFDGDVHLALVAYNRGPTRLSRQLRSGATITSRYADRILGLYQDLEEQRLTILGVSG
jgi:soluble lytic murein transglycosylase-like protein